MLLLLLPLSFDAHKESSVKSKTYEVINYVIFYSLLLFRPSEVKIFPSALCCHIPSICVVPVVSEVRVHIV